MEPEFIIYSPDKERLGYIISSVFKSYGIRYQELDNTKEMMKLSRGHCNPSCGIVVQHIPTGKCFLDFLALCSFIKENCQIYCVNAMPK